MLFYQAFPVVHRGKWGLVFMACCCCMHACRLLFVGSVLGLAILFSRLRLGGLVGQRPYDIMQSMRFKALRRPRTPTPNLEIHDLSKGLLCMVVDEKVTASCRGCCFSFLVLGE